VKQLRSTERYLLGKIINILAEHGAIGGRTAQGSGSFRVVDGSTSHDPLLNQANQRKTVLEEWVRDSRSSRNNHPGCDLTEYRTISPLLFDPQNVSLNEKRTATY